MFSDYFTSELFYDLFQLDISWCISIMHFNYTKNYSSRINAVWHYVVLISIASFIVAYGRG